MKTKLSTVVLLITIAVMSVSCGSQKKLLEAQNQMLLMQQQQEQKQYSETRPRRTARTIDPCIELAQADSPNIRSYGTAKSYVEKVALNEAERDARNKMALMMKTAIEGAAQDYEHNANTNLKTTAQTLGKAVMTQFVSQEISNTRVVKTSIYDLADGSIEVYVCLEMQKDIQDIKEGVSNVLDKNKVLEIESNRERFLDKMSDGLKEYKNRIANQQ